MDVPGPETEILSQAAKEAEVFLGIGVIEREGTHGGTLYCTLLLFGPSGDLFLRHRKLKPTAAERVIWGEGRGDDLDLAVTEHGKMGGLICWENYMPLARAALYQQGVDFYLAPTADARDSWQYTLRHIAREGGCFVLGCNQYVTKSMYPREYQKELSAQPEEMCRGGSAIISPLGDVLAGPLYGEEGILIADLQLDQIAKARFDFDPAGHYARPDVFDFGVRQ
jgi:nitrilase